MTHGSTQMKAIQAAKTGGPDVLQYVDLPKPTTIPAGHVLVKNKFVGINFIDAYHRSGLYPLPAYPAVLGKEASGVIEELGPSQPSNIKLTVGQEVVYMYGATYAEYAVVPTEAIIPLRSSVPLPTAAAALLQGLTGIGLVRRAYAIQRGDRVLIHAAAGGMGLLLCQLAKYMGAGLVIGTTSTQEKADLAKAHGADHVILYTKEDTVAKVKQLTQNQGVNVVYDGVGQDTVDTSIACLGRRGYWISYGNASGPIKNFDVFKMVKNNTRFERFVLTEDIQGRDELVSSANELFELIEKKQLKINIYKTYPLKEAAQAHKDLEGRKTTGKLLLSV